MQTIQQYMVNKKEGMKQTRQDVKDTVMIGQVDRY